MWQATCRMPSKSSLNCLTTTSKSTTSGLVTTRLDRVGPVGCGRCFLFFACPVVLQHTEMFLPFLPGAASHWPCHLLITVHWLEKNWHKACPALIFVAGSRGFHIQIDRNQSVSFFWHHKDMQDVGEVKIIQNCCFCLVNPSS